jgi:beta-mannosidase
MLREYPEPKDFASFVYLSQVQQAEAIKVGAEHLRRNRSRTMGALFWQLNDCWPVASWSSIDYFGRWKALHYYARRFYGDLLVSPYTHDGVIDVYVISDKLQVTVGEVRMRLLSFDGKTLLDKTQAVNIPPQSSSVNMTLTDATLSSAQKLLSGSGSPDGTFLVFDLRIDGQTVSRNEVFFDHMRSLKLPLNPAIQSEVGGSGPEYTITLRSPVLARDVYLSFGDLNITLSDNYFDLLPGEPMVLKVSGSADLGQLQRALKITSLTDAFFEERPTYREHLRFDGDGRRAPEAPTK